MQVAMRLNYATRTLEYYCSLGKCDLICVELGLRLAEDMARVSHWMAQPENASKCPKKCDDLRLRRFPVPDTCKV